MKERPILFSAPMVRAILSGNKTQTRRVVKPQPKNDRVGMVNAAYCGFPHTWLVDGAVSEYTCEDEKAPIWVCPYGQVGDRLWVRENFWRDRRDDGCVVMDADGYTTVKPPRGDLSNGQIFPVDGLKTHEFWRKHPSIHMPRWASRITLEITGVRVERLQVISEADAQAEGCESRLEDLGNGNDHAWYTAGDEYQRLWNSINGAGSWEANPWVWVVEFKRVEGGAA